MHKKYNKFLIVSFIGVSILGFYSYFYNDLNSEAASDDDSALSSSLGNSNAISSVAASGGSKASEDTAFLMKLASLKSIKINTSILGSSSFKSLVDNDIKLEPAPFGRVNPFAPVAGFVVNNNEPTFSIITIDATLITNKSATLNGTIEGASSNNIYFEYGTTEALGKVTPKVTPNLAGSFNSSLALLLPKTTYFFRSVANINGTLSYGEIISFNTN